MVFRDTESLIFSQKKKINPCCSEDCCEQSGSNKSSIFSRFIHFGKKESGPRFTIFSGIKFGFGMFVGVMIAILLIATISFAVISYVPESATTNLTGMAVNLFSGM